MAKKTNIKQRKFSIKLKTCFVLQVHLEELDMIKETASQFPEPIPEHNEFIEMMVEALCKSLHIIFPNPFDA